MFLIVRLAFLICEVLMNRYIAFLKVFERNSFSDAARDLGYTQSAVSQMIKSLEEELGVTLLVFAACFVVTKTVATVRPLCYLATGKTYAEACRSCNWAATFRRLRGHSTEKK